MKRFFLAPFVAIVIASAVAGCMTTGPSAEQADAAVNRGKELAALRDSGKITWREWAAGSNQSIRATFPDLSLRMQAALQYREAVAAEIDAGKITKESGLYLISQKFADAQSEDDRDRSMRRSASRSGGGTVVCNRVGTTTICN